MSEDQDDTLMDVNNNPGEPTQDQDTAPDTSADSAGSNLLEASNLASTVPSIRNFHQRLESATEQDVVIAKRRAIQAIMKDSSLADEQKRMKIQELMSGSRGTPVEAIVASTGISSVLPPTLVLDPIACTHYERKCNIVAPCCGQVFGCRVCHDDSTAAQGHGPLDRFAIREVICKECTTRQPASNTCINCNVTFGEYHCGICNLWMAESKKPFHCDECGLCRVGGKDAFRHCEQCCMCIDVRVYNSHNCMKDKYKNNCPICREDMFSSRQSPQDLPCGHAIHAHCFRKLASFDYRCPICKKTVVSQESMADAWVARARDIEMQPMPPDLARVVNIMCNDCEEKAQNRNSHFLGVQCPTCNSFNTVVEHVVSSGSDTYVPASAASS